MVQQHPAIDMDACYAITSALASPASLSSNSTAPVDTWLLEVDARVLPAASCPLCLKDQLQGSPCLVYVVIPIATMPFPSASALHVLSSSSSRCLVDCQLISSWQTITLLVSVGWLS